MLFNWTPGSESEYKHEGRVEVALLARAEAADGLAKSVRADGGRLLDEDARR